MTSRDPGADPAPKPGTIYLDPDACPVKDQVYKVAARYGIPLKEVANTWSRVPEMTCVHWTDLPGTRVCYG